MVAAFVGNAGAEAVTPKQETTGDKCYLIGTADELEGFAKNVAATGFTGCAKLTADIHYLGNAQLLNNDRTGLQKDENGSIIPCDGSDACGGVNLQWTPLKNFAGTFDGQGHTIYGLYAVSASSVGFVSRASGTSTIENLHIADSYF